jgi:hypothetical protein
MSAAADLAALWAAEKAANPELAAGFYTGEAAPETLPDVGYVSPGGSIFTESGTYQVAELGVGEGVGAALLAAVPVVGSAIGTALGLPAWLLSILGIGGAAVAAGGLGVDLWPFDVTTIPGTDVELGGPGLAEPTALRQWVAGGTQFYKLADGRMASYGRASKRWRVWRPQKMLVLSRNPRVKNLLTADKRLHKLMKGMRTAVNRNSAKRTWHSQPYSRRRRT